MQRAEEPEQVAAAPQRAERKGRAGQIAQPPHLAADLPAMVGSHQDWTGLVVTTAYSKVMRFLDDPAPVIYLPEELETDIDDPRRFVAWLIAERDTLTEHQLCNAMRVLISLSYEQVVELAAAAEFAKGLLTHPSSDVRSRGIVAFHRLWVIPGRKCTVEEVQLIAAAAEAGVNGEAQSLLVELGVPRGGQA